MPYQPEDMMPSMPQPTAPDSVPVGAVDAPAGSKLYELAARRQGRAQPKRRAESNPAKQQLEHQKRMQDALASLMSKAVVGTERPGDGMVPFGQLPKAVRSAASEIYKAPIVGFDPNKLTPAERMVLGRLVSVGEQEFAQANPDAVNPDTAPAPGMPGAPNVRGRY